MEKLIKRVTGLHSDESGQTFIELGLVIIFVVLAAVFTIKGLSGAIGDAYDGIESEIESHVAEGLGG